MTDEVAPGVWWLSGTRGCNVYLVRADDGSFVVIDSGFAGSAEAIVGEVRAITADATITHLLLTHTHADHTGAAAEVARELGAALTAGAADCVVVEGRPRLPPPDGPLRRLRGLLPFGGEPRGPGDPVEITLSGLTAVAPGIDAYAVPGHTPGSYCYVARRANACFVGDLVIGHRRGLSRSLAGANDNDGQYTNEMLRFAGHASDLGCPGHGYPRPNFASALEHLARDPREPWALGNTPGRLWRLAAFVTYVMRKRR
jgi:glyoxylase-like metal-dependent hydrolase (beta-lactamase superfamily II)